MEPDQIKRTRTWKRLEGLTLRYEMEAAECDRLLSLDTSHRTPVEQEQIRRELLDGRRWAESTARNLRAILEAEFP